MHSRSEFGVHKFEVLSWLSSSCPWPLAKLENMSTDNRRIHPHFLVSQRTRQCSPASRFPYHARLQHAVAYFVYHPLDASLSRDLGAHACWADVFDRRSREMPHRAFDGHVCHWGPSGGMRAGSVQDDTLAWTSRM